MLDAGSYQVGNQDLEGVCDWQVNALDEKVIGTKPGSEYQRFSDTDHLSITKPGHPFLAPTVTWLKEHLK